MSDRDEAPAARPQRIAILGGGLSALTTAFELTSTEDWPSRYEITVYQMGFRLGGKGASGRNGAVADRIEEHGLHVFFGFYANALSLMRRCYRELGRAPDAPLCRFEDAFKPRHTVVMQELHGQRWQHWPIVFPRRSSALGPDAQPFEMLAAALSLAWDFYQAGGLGAELAQLDQAPGPALPGDGPAFERAVPPLADEVRAFAAQAPPEDGPPTRLALFRLSLRLRLRARQLGLGDDGQASYLGVAAALTGARDQHADGQVSWDVIAWLLEQFQAWVDRNLGADSALNYAWHQVWVFLRLATAIGLGMIRDELVREHRWHAIDDRDLSEWLASHGAPAAVLSSAPVRTLYAAAFASGTRSAAGTALYGCLRLLFTYEGAVLFEMQAGMGDVIFAPLYEVLRRRGVRFQFFHRVEHLCLGEPDAQGRRELAAVKFHIQASVKDGPPHTYEPLIDVGGLPCWPSEPDYDQLVEDRPEEQFEDELNLENWWSTREPVREWVARRGEDFDVCVLGISIGAFPYICQELIEDQDNPRFKNMVDRVRTTLTQAAQLWLRPTLAECGWELPRPVVIPYAESYDTWAEMDHLLARESWVAAGQHVGSLAYLCARLPEPEDQPPPPRSAWDYPLGQRARARRNLARWLRLRAGHLWPTLVRPDGSFDTEALVTLGDEQGQARLDAQWCVAALNPSDRYVLSTAGTTKHRLAVDASGYENLILTGDWTRLALSAGCAEAATEAGMRAARAICGSPVRIAGDWLEDPRRVWPPPPDGRPVVPYRRRRGDLLSPPPLTAKGAVMYCYGFPADRARLQALCDRQLNPSERVGEPPAVRYQVAAGAVVFAAVRIAKAYPDDARPAGAARPLGWMPEQDFSFWVPLHVYARGHDRPRQLVWFQPYMWVDNPAAVSDGREASGFDKSLATLGFVDDVFAPRFSIDAVAPAPGQASRQHDGAWHPQRLLDVQPACLGSQPPQLQLVAQGALSSLRSALSRPGPGADRAGWQDTLAWCSQLLTLRQDLVALKQFPRPDDPDETSYQAVVVIPARPTSAAVPLPLPGVHALIASETAHARVLQPLGLAATRLHDGRYRLCTALPLRVAYDFEMGEGYEVRRIVGGHYIQNPLRIPDEGPGREPRLSARVRHHAFALRADRLRLARLCDELLNFGPERYAPAAELCVVTCSDAPLITRVVAGTGGRRRSMPERRMTFWLPLQVEREPHGHADRLVWFAVYDFCSNAETVRDEREQFGTATSFAHLSLAPDAVDAPAQALEVEAIASSLRGQQARFERLVRIEGGTFNGAASPPAAAHPLGWCLPALPGDRAGKPDATAATMLSLRQYPSVDDVGGVCHQALVETPMSLPNIACVRTGNGFSVAIDRFPTHEIAASLGLAEPRAAARDRCRVPVQAAWYFESDAETRGLPRETYRLA